MTDDRRDCPDTGKCSHECAEGEPCYRVVTCGPLSIAKFPGDRWPDDILRANGVDPRDRLTIRDAAQAVLDSRLPPERHQESRHTYVADQALANLQYVLDSSDDI